MKNWPDPDIDPHPRFTAFGALVWFIVLAAAVTLFVRWLEYPPHIDVHPATHTMTEP